MTEVEVEQTPPKANCIDINENENNNGRPADIEADMREMEQRKRVEVNMQSRLFREELERIVDNREREGAIELIQPLTEMVGATACVKGVFFKTSNCVLPINDIRGVEAIGDAKGEQILRCKLAATLRLLDLQGYTQCLGAQVTVRLNADQELFLVNPSGLLSHEVTASSLNKVDMQGNVVQYGTTNFGINSRHYTLHSAVHAARPDISCVIYINCSSVVAVSGLTVGLLPVTQNAVMLGEVSLHKYTGPLHEPEEREKLVQSLGNITKVLLLTNHGALCCGETIEEAFFAAYHIVQACETQLKMMPIGIDKLNLFSEEERKTIYESSRRPPEDYETRTNQIVDNNKGSITGSPEWCVGSVEFEALMRMLDNAGFRTGYIYRNRLLKYELPATRSSGVEVLPVVSSLGYLLEEEELNRHRVLQKVGLRKVDNRRWLNSPNFYQKVVEVLETGTPNPKKITKWVADVSPTKLPVVRNIKPMQFVPPSTNPKEFKKLQQLMKDNRRADKISAGPQSQILKECVSCDETNHLKDVTISGPRAELGGTPSKGLIQRRHKNNEELNDYKDTIERERHGDSSGYEANLSDTSLTNTHTLVPRRLYVELEDQIAKRKPQVNNLRQLDLGTATTSEQDEFDLSGISSDNEYISFFAQPTSPFRTVSHFGFNSPAKNPSPTHFHVPTECTKYVGVIAELSIEELFATKKYLDYPDDLVPLIQRRKKLSRSIIRGRVERRRRSPPKPNALFNGCREYLVHGSGQLPHQLYIKMLEKYFVNTPYIHRKEEEIRANFEETVHALVTEMIEAENIPEKLNTIAEEASDIKDDSTDTGSIVNNHDAESDMITMIEVQPLAINSVVDSVPITTESLYDRDALKAPGKLEITSMVENFLKQLTETRFSNESPNLDYRPDEKMLSPQSCVRSVLSRSDREARRAEFIELWEDHLDYVSTQERLATAQPDRGNNSPTNDQNINDDLNSSNFDSMDNLDETVGDLVSSLTESSASYEPIERTIIDKINLHRLDQEDDIFIKIKQTIYDHNSSKFDQTATNNQLVVTPTARKSTFLTSTPTNSTSPPTKSTSPPKFTQNRKQASRTSTPRQVTSDTEALAVKGTKRRPINKSFELKLKASSGYTTASSVTSDDEQTITSRTQRKARNFIAENIKKVSARGSREKSTTTRDHFKTPLKSKTASVNSFMKSSTKTGSSLLWLTVSPSTDDLSKYSSELSSFASSGVSLNTANKQLQDDPTAKSAEITLLDDTSSENVLNVAERDHPNDLTSKDNDNMKLVQKCAKLLDDTSSENVLNVAERDHPNDLTSKDNDNMKLVQKCAEHIVSLRFDDINLDIDEIYQIHNDDIAERAADRELYEAELAEDWRSYNRIAFSLSGEED